MRHRHQMHGVHMAGAGARAFQAVVCAIPANNGPASAGSWSYTDLTTRKPGPARLTSASAT